MKTINLGEKTNMTVSRSAKFKTVQIELQKRKDNGQMRKGYLTVKSCRALLALQKEVQTIATLMKLNPATTGQGEDVEGESDSRDDGGRAVELPLDDRRSLTVRKWHANGSVSMVLETTKDGLKQPALNFNLDESEWLALHHEADNINEAIDALANGLYAEQDERIKMYRWFIVTPDGEQIVDVGATWQYSEQDAQEDAKNNVRPGNKSHLEYKLVKPPSKDTMHTAVMCHLIRQNIQAFRRDACPGCGPDEDHQPNQLAHFGMFGTGCLDPLEEIDDVTYNRASGHLSPMAMADLYHSIASVLKIPTSVFPQPDLEKISADQMKAIALYQIPWQWEDLIDLCSKVHRHQTLALLPTMKKM